LTLESFSEHCFTRHLCQGWFAISRGDISDEELEHEVVFVRLREVTRLGGRRIGTPQGNRCCIRHG
jgi:hypothetical protein